MKHTSRTSAGSQPSGRRPPGFEGVPVALLGAFCIDVFNLICFVGGQGSPKDYVTEVSSSLVNFHIMKNLVSDFRNKHLHFPEVPDFGNRYKIGTRQRSNWANFTQNFLLN